MSKGIILRCDYFQGSGFGHLRRTNILANSLKQRGFKPLLLIDNIPSKKNISIDVEFEKISLKKFDELKDANLVISYAKLKNAKVVVVDSYRISEKWVNSLKQNKLKVILIDDFNKDLGSDLSINYTPFNKIGGRNTSISINNLRGPQFFLTDSKSCLSKKSFPERIVAHAGGNGDYSKAKYIYSKLAEISDANSIKVDWICPNSLSLNSIKKNIEINKNDKILGWKKDISTLWSNYEIVVGPASTSLYESIIQGTLPVSFPIANNQVTNLKDWLSIGHSLHISNDQKENYSYINSILELAIYHYKKFLNILNANSKVLDGKGVERVVDSIESLIFKSSNTLFDDKNNFLKEGVYKCNIRDSESFLNARNSKEVREMSTNPNHIITWPEHLKWWVNDEIDKYFFIGSDNSPEVYFWVKKWEINKKKFLTAGWFPANKKTPFISIL